MITLSTRIEWPLFGWLHDAAHRRGISVAELTRRLLNDARTRLEAEDQHAAALARQTEQALLAEARALASPLDAA